MGCIHGYLPADLARIHTKIEGSKTVRLNFSGKGVAKAKPSAKDRAKKPNGNNTKGQSKGKTTEEVPEEANNAVDKHDDGIKCEQDSESLKTMEWADDMVWVLDSSSQVLVAQGLSLTTQLLPEEEMAWRSGMHLICRKKCKYFKTSSSADITSGADEHVDFNIGHC